MGVIGRLDEQVDAVLITPLERGRGREEGEQAEADEDTGARAESPRRPRAQADEQAGAEELPVWLL